MKTWIEVVVEASDAAQRAKEAREQEAFDQRFTPLVDRLRALIETFPEGERHKPRPISFFTPHLRPKRQGKGAHPGEVADALRKLGWIRKRQWRDGHSSFSALWYPPEHKG